jgi:hypothetical protein
MANGTKLQVGFALDRLLNETLPRFFDARIKENRAQENLDYVRQRDEDIRTESARRFDISIANQQAAIERNEQRYRDQQQTNLENRVRLEQKELDAEMAENEVLEVMGVNDIRNTAKAKEYLGKITGTLETPKAQAIARRYLAQIEAFEKSPDTSLNALSGFLNEEQFEQLSSMNSWKKPLNFTDVNNYLTTIGTIDKLENQEIFTKLKYLGNRLDYQKALLKDAGDYERDLKGVVIPDNLSPTNASINKISADFQSLLGQYGQLIDSAGFGAGANKQVAPPGVGDEVRVDGAPGAVIQLQNTSSSEASKVSVGGLVTFPGNPITFVKTGDNEFQTFNDDEFIKAANALNVSIDAPAEASDMPGQSSIERFVSQFKMEDKPYVLGDLASDTEMEAPPGGVSGGFVRLLRGLPGVQRQMGTGKGGFLSMEGSPKEQVEAVGLLDRNTKIILENLKDARKEQVSLVEGFETSEEYQTQKRENNTSLQNYIQNAYEAYLDERTTPAVKSKLKKFLSEFKSLAGKPMITGQATLGRGDTLRPIRVTGGENIFNKDTIDLLNQIEL